MKHVLRHGAEYSAVSGWEVLPAVEQKRYKVIRVDISSEAGSEVLLFVGDADNATTILHQTLAANGGYTFQLHGMMELGLNKAINITTSGAVLVVIHYKLEAP